MHISSRRLGVWTLFLIIILLAIPAMAQTNRIIVGKVTDDKDQPIANAPIEIQSTTVKTRVYKTKTDKKGQYVYMGLPADEFRVVIRAAGFQPDFKSPVKPNIQEETRVDFKLNPGADRKLAFEMSDKELAQLKQEVAKEEKKSSMSGAIQADLNAGAQLAQQGKHLEAIEEFKKALEKDPEEPIIMANMAESYSKLDKNAEALELFQKAVAINPNDASLYSNMGVVLSKMGKTAESQEAFKKAAALNPGASAQNFYNVGATLVNSGQSAQAVEAFKQAIVADPNFAEAYYQLGISLSGNQETYPDAVKALQKYLEIGQKQDQKDVAKAIIQTLEQALKKK